MSKSSNTNYPNVFLHDVISFSGYVKFNRRGPVENTRSLLRRRPYAEDIVLLGGYSGEVPPLPIPNREVKLTNADGTAVFPWESR